MIIRLLKYKVVLDLSPRVIALLATVLALSFLLELLIKKLRERRYLHFANFATLRRIEGAARFYSPPFLLFLRFLILSSIVFLLFGGLNVVSVEKVSNRSVGFVIDTSITSTYPVGGKTLLQIEKDTVLEISRMLPKHTKIVVVTYGADAKVVYEGKNEQKAVKEKLEEIRPDIRAGAELKGALELAVRRLEKNGIVFLFSFGGVNTGGNLTEVAYDAREKNIEIIATVFSMKKEEKVEELEDLKRFEVSGIQISTEDLNTTARITGGKIATVEAVKAESSRISTELSETFAEIKMNERVVLLEVLAVMLVAELVLSALYGAI